MKKPQAGFTIVELLIVVVVIAILAAITIVAYNGIQARSRSAIQVSDLNRLSKQITLFEADNGRYPNSDADFKKLLVDAGYWDVSRPTVPDSTRKYFIYCLNASDVGIVYMNTPGSLVVFATGAPRPTWKKSTGIVQLSEQNSTDSNTCPSVGIGSMTYSNWAHNLT